MKLSILDIQGVGRLMVWHTLHNNFKTNMFL